MQHYYFYYYFILAVKEEMETIPAVPDNATFNEVEPIGEWAVVVITFTLMKNQLIKHTCCIY